jgi:hypothetical protein
VPIGIRPPLLLDPRGVRQREAKQVFDFSKRQDDLIRISVAQVLM